MTRLAGVVFSQSGEFIVIIWSDLYEVRNLETFLDLLGPFS